MASVAASVTPFPLTVCPAYGKDEAVYAIRLNILRNDKTIATPVLKVVGGSTASIAVSGKDGYSLSTLVTPMATAAASPVKVSISLTPEGQSDPVKFTIITPLQKEAGMTIQNGGDSYRFIVNVDAAQS